MCKWAGGTVALGYDARNKKLVVNKTEAETVRTIFRLYTELKSFGRLVAELDRRRHCYQAQGYQGRQIQWGLFLHLRSPRLSSQESSLHRQGPSSSQMVQGRTARHPRPADL